jgi:hypothetical protein
MKTVQEIRAQLDALVRILEEVDNKLAAIQQTGDVRELDEAASEGRSLILDAQKIAWQFLRQASGSPAEEEEEE